MEFLTTRGKILVGGLFLLLLLSTAFSSFIALAVLNQNHHLEERNESLVQQAEELRVRITQLENGELK
jgi:CHASE3 domain sensor protein